MHGCKVCRARRHGADSSKASCAEQCGCAGKETHLRNRPKIYQAALGDVPESVIAICSAMHKKLAGNWRTALKMEVQQRTAVSSIFSGCRSEGLDK